MFSTLEGIADVSAQIALLLKGLKRIVSVRQYIGNVSITLNPIFRIINSMNSIIPNYCPCEGQPVR